MGEQSRLSTWPDVNVLKYTTAVPLLPEVLDSLNQSAYCHVIGFYPDGVSSKQTLLTSVQVVFYGLSKGTCK
jgi:hypothetical protein